MKKIKITFAAMAIAVGTFAAFAFSPATKTIAADENMYHWFDAEDGNYLGQRTQAAQQALCGIDNDVPCADGFTGVSGTNPSGSYIDTVNKQ